MEKKVIDLFSGKNIVQNDGKKYSEMLLELIDPFEYDFSDNMTPDDIINFGCYAWNLSCLSQIMPKNEFKKLLKGSDDMPKSEMIILKKMISLKKKKFASYDRFINDFDVKEVNGQFELTVLTEDKESFLASIIEETNDSLIQETNFENAYINRFAIIVKPLEPFFNWINAIYPEDAPHEVDEANVYLVDDGIDDIEKWLKKKFDKFFMMELEDWHTNKKEWPQKRSYKMFKQWFSVDISTMVYDMENRPVLKED